MRFFPILAHGAGLLSALGLMVISAVGAVICFLTAGAISLDKSEPARQKAHRLTAIGVACVGVAVVSPWIAQILGLP